MLSSVASMVLVTMGRCYVACPMTVNPLSSHYILFPVVDLSAECCRPNTEFLSHLRLGRWLNLETHKPTFICHHSHLWEECLVCSGVNVLYNWTYSYTRIYMKGPHIFDKISKRRWLNKNWSYDPKIIAGKIINVNILLNNHVN